jgi:hypothetical protein
MQAPLWISPADARDPYGDGDVAVDGAGNAYLLRTAMGFEGARLKSNTSAWGLIKYDAQGAKLWTRMWGETEFSFAHGAAIGPQGSVYVVGRMLGASIAKFDSAGNRKWYLHARVVKNGDQPNSEFLDVIADREGNAIAAGSSTLDLNDSGNVDRGILLAKYSGEGKPVWKRRFDRSQANARSIAMDSKGNLYLTGSVNEDWDGQKNHGQQDFFLLKCNPAGEKMWVRQYGTSRPDIGIYVAVDASDNILSIGYSGHDLGDSINAGGFDVNLYKHDKDGNLIYAKQDGRVIFSLRYNAYAQSPEGGIQGTLTAMVEPPAKRNQDRGVYQTYMVKYGPDGEKLRSSPIGQTNWGVTEGTAVDSRGFIYLACGTADPKRNAEDACIAKFQQP